MQEVTMTIAEARALSQRVLEYHGLSPDDAQAVARTIVAGQRDDCQSHGLYRLLSCAHTLKAGKVATNVTPVITRPAPAIVRADAGGGFAQPAFEATIDTFVDTARAHGIAALALVDCVHFSALWPEVEMLVERGLAILCCTPSHAWVAPSGGSQPLFGTNPIAFGWPRPGKTPFVFDFATSAVARGEIELHARQGMAIPPDWGIGPDGAPSTDPHAVLAGAMRTFGGHKGSALALMVELLAGPLIGDMTSAESLAFDDGARASPRGGVLFLALDPSGFLGTQAEAHLDRAEALFEAITEMGARLPSARRHAARQRTDSEGMTIPAALHRDILALLSPV